MEEQFQLAAYGRACNHPHDHRIRGRDPLLPLLLNSQYPQKDEQNPTWSNLIGCLVLVAVGFFVFRVVQWSLYDNDDCPMKLHGLPSEQENDAEQARSAHKPQAIQRFDDPDEVFEYLLAEHPLAKPEQRENAADVYRMVLDHGGTIKGAFEAANKEIQICLNPAPTPIPPTLTTP